MSGDMERIREALQFIDASDRETWLRMGMAIKSELADAGFDLWEAWSLQAESFNTKDARDVWKSIRAGGKVTIGTLFYEAKANGWRDDGMHQKPTPEELAERRRIAAERAAKEEAEIARERAATASRAAAILQAATEAKADHPYLERKRVSPVATLREIDAGATAAILGYAPKSSGERLTGRLLVVPVNQGDSLSTLELIDGGGRKAALAGRGSKVGGYWATESLPDDDGTGLTLLIGEGVATVLSASAATGHPAIAALSAGNLPAVAKAMRERYPAAALVILADLVKATGQPDFHASEAARAVSGQLAIPDFGGERPDGATDFNDLAALRGMEAVKTAVATATVAIFATDDRREQPQPLDESTLTDDELRLLGALRAIPKGACSGKHPAEDVIGWGLRHNDSGIKESVGLALAVEWDRINPGYNTAAGVFRGSDPNYSATKPVTSASIFDLAKQHGWKGEIPWRQPQPLTAKVESEPYPLDALPDSIRAVVEEVTGFVKAPIPMVASSALAALSLAIQAHADAKRAEKLHGPVGLFLLTIADSGERKSTCDGFFTKAIRDYEEAQAEAAKPALKDYKADSEAWDAKRNGIKEKIRQLAKEQKPTASMELALRDLEHTKPEPPRIPRLLYADATPEALAYGLARQWPSGGVVSAEAGIVFGSHGMGKDSVMRNLGLLNQLWDGNSLTIDRRTTESFTVRGARLTVALQVQEPTLREFFTRSGTLARGTGFLARFLVAWPQSTQGYRPFTEAPPNWPHLAAFHQRITAILNQPVPIDENGALTPPLLPLTAEAKAAWIEYHDAIENELRSGGELYDVRDVASKSADNAARLAALFQIFEQGMGGAVGLDAFESASRVAAWHLSEARRFFGELALPAELADAARLDSWLIEYCQREKALIVGKNHVRQFGPLRDGAALDAAIRELANLDRLRLGADGKRRTLQINPALVTP
jgi:phage/plasmid primase-like uncharacterized protein